MLEGCRAAKAIVPRSWGIAAAAGVLLAIGALFLAKADTPAREIPIWWSPRLHLASTKDIPQLLHEPVAMAGNEPGLLVMDKQQRTRRVFTCSQYLEATENGFFPATQYEEYMESFFVNRCYALRDLERARPATRSYVRHDRWPANALSEIPPLLQTDVTPKLEKALTAEKSWRWFDPHVRVSIGDPDPLVLSAEDDFSSYGLEILASGDFSGGGFEELAVSGGVRSKEGTYFKSYYYILSRTRKDVPMQVLTEMMAPYRLGIPRNRRVP
jgi:hypothetical protein